MPKNTEIELKLPLLNGDEVIKYLSRNAKFAFESFQHDVYYNPAHRNFLEDEDNVNEWLRIRVAEEKAQINYKDWQPHDTKIKTHCTEYETNVDSYDQLQKILSALNFTKLVEVKKTRQAWNYMDVEISIDSVEGLGDFIELEYKGKLNDVVAVRKVLFEVLQKLGARTEELDIRGYPYLLMEKNDLFKSSK